MRRLWLAGRGGRLTRQAGVLVLVCVGLLALAGAVVAARHIVDGSAVNSWPYAPQNKKAEVLAAVGDISCQPGSPQEGESGNDVCDQGKGATTRNQAQTATANQVEGMKPNLVAVLGDEQYQNGYYQDFMGSFDTTWGAFKFLQRPAPGNHEFYTNHGQTGVHGDGYFDYYNGYQHNLDGTQLKDTFTNSSGGTFTQPKPRPYGQAGPHGTNGDGWYSYNLGHWHIISLNAECAVQLGGCSPSGSWFSSESQWLADDLNADHQPCTMAYWHQPTFGAGDFPTAGGPVVGQPGTDGQEGGAADAWWKLLYAHHADLILNGHDHVYSRFAPMDPSGNADPQNGIREFIIGTGGESLDPVNPNTPNLQAWANQYYGVMKLTLKPGGYAWDYESAMENPSAPPNTPSSYSDTGSASCHSASDGNSNS